MAPIGSSVGALYRKLYVESKNTPEDGRICRPKISRADLKRLIKGKVVASCLLFTSVSYIFI